MVSKGESSIITDFLGIQPNLASGNQRWLDGNSTIYRKCTINPQHKHDWLVVWNMNFIFPYIFRGVETTNQMNLKIHFGGVTCWLSGVAVHQTESVSNAGAKASLAYAGVVKMPVIFSSNKGRDCDHSFSDLYHPSW